MYARIDKREKYFVSKWAISEMIWHAIDEMPRVEKAKSQNKSTVLWLFVCGAVLN